MSGSHLCTACKLTVTRTKGSECSPCRRFKDGKSPLKQKEAAFMTYLNNAIESGRLPEYTSHDKCVSLGLDPLLFGSNRPDVLWRLKTHWVIVEVDESQHKGNSYSCERRRELELCNCADGLPVHLIRFNPDPFSTGSKSSRVKSDGESISQRHAAVILAVKSAVEEVNPTGLTFQKLFFDCTCMGGKNGKHACNFTHSNFYADHEAFLMTFQ
jgi:hypothetical protein